MGKKVSGYRLQGSEQWAKIIWNYYSLVVFWPRRGLITLANLETIGYLYKQIFAK